jgi:tetratricopeptide (TPR) repeat protein/SAM-dependent methyltransferase
MTAAPDTRQLLHAAMAQHQAGRLQQAEGLYRQVLAADPRQIMALRYLGILLHQTGRHAGAAEMLGQAIAEDEGDADTHYNIGAVLQALGRLDQAATHYAKVIALSPGTPEAHYELGNVLARQDHDDDAAAAYRRALALRPNHVEALTNLGSVLQKQGRTEEAAARWNEALALQPQYPVARMNLGLVLKQQGKLQEAVAQFRGAIAVHPGFADAHYNLGGTLQALGQWDEARDAYRRALAGNPGHVEALGALVAVLLAEGSISEALRHAGDAFAANESDETRSALAACLGSPLLQPNVGDLRGVLARALTEAWVRPATLALAAARFLALNPAIRDAMARAETDWPNAPAAAELGIAALAEEPLLRALLETSSVPSLAVERLATALRSSLLTTAEAAAAVPEPVLRLYSAVARQCFINSYVFAQSETEARRAGALRDAVAAALQSGTPIAPLAILAVAAYFPLAVLPGHEALLQGTWPAAVSDIVQQQVAAPVEERRLRASIPPLTAIEAGVSSAVREQYEENPYPQWTRMLRFGKPQTVDAHIRQKCPLAPFAGASGSDGPEMLVAGCGTGQHSIEAASRFRNARALAVDLSLTSLAYAQRQTHALKIGNVEYAQADIANLPALGRSFDIIESVGVLHHLADPFGGWRALVSMLRPGGLMLIGLYSETARRELAAARSFIAERGYHDHPSDNRRFRQDYLQHATGPARDLVVSMLDFFSLSECRDLLFHRQEHRMTLPDIARFLEGNGLRFLGFKIDLQHRRAYARQFPEDAAMTDLARWHRYETDNPRTFIQMYQFWVQKKLP